MLFALSDPTIAPVKSALQAAIHLLTRAAAVGLGVALIGCSLRFQPLIAHRVWTGKTRAEVFDAAVRVLHVQDYLIAAAEKDSGVIATDWKSFKADDQEYRIRLNLLVFDEAPGSVALSFKSLVQERDERDWVDLDPDTKLAKQDYGRITRELDDFFLEVQRYVGPSVQRR